MTASAFVAQGIRSAILDLRRFWGRIKTAFIIGLVAAFALATTAAGALLGVHAAHNRSIAALIGGHDVAVATDAAPKLIFARAYFLMNHGRLEDAQAMVSMLDIRGSKRLRADLHYDMANASLKVAFDKIDKGDIDAAAAFVSLAREDYREAMRLDPDDWNARFNFDVASRLVREYPTFGFTPDPRRRGPRPLWTELPNTPQGEP
jgi:mxaK protein